MAEWDGTTLTLRFNAADPIEATNFCSYVLGYPPTGITIKQLLGHLEVVDPTGTVLVKNRPRNLLRRPGQPIR